MEPNKNEKKIIGWPGEDLHIEKYSSNVSKSLKKREKTVKRINKVLKALNSNSFDVLIWIKGFKGKVFFLTYFFFKGFILKVILFWKYLKFFTEHAFFDNAIMLIVIMNTILLCLDGLLDESQSQTLKIISKVLTFIFLGELILKLLAMGPFSKKKYSYTK